MVTLAPDIAESIQRFVSKIQKLYNVQSIYLFGSQARGRTDQWSDIDLLVISPDFAEDCFEAQVALLSLASHFDTRLEPYPMAPEDFNISNPLAYEMQQRGVRISLEGADEE